MRFMTRRITAVQTKLCSETALEATLSSKKKKKKKLHVALSATTSRPKHEKK